MESMKDQLQIGKAGEYLVCSDLLSQGYNSFLADQGLNYDVVVDVGGRLLKIQVKTASQYRNHGQRKNQGEVYQFNCRRCGKGGRKAYGKKDFHLISLVSLKEKIVAYFLPDKTKISMTLRSPEKRGTYNNEVYNYRRRKKPYRYLDQFPFKNLKDKIK
jgi:hypothetical protein